MNVSLAAGIGAQTEPSVYFTPLTSVLPAPFVSPAAWMSAARLNRRTAEPDLGGTNEAAIVSTAVDLDGGQAGAHLFVGEPRFGQPSLMTTTSGPGVNGIDVLSNCAPRVPPVVSQTVNVPVPLLKLFTQPAATAIQGYEKLSNCCR